MGKYKLYTISHLFTNINSNNNTSSFNAFAGGKIKRFPSEVKMMNGRVVLTISPRTAQIINLKINEVDNVFLQWMNSKFRGQDYRSAREHIDAWVNEYDLDLDNK